MDRIVENYKGFMNEDNNNETLQNVIDRYNEKYDGLGSKFIKMFPDKDEYDDELMGSYQLDEEEMENYDGSNEDDWKDYLMDLVCGDYESEFLKIDIMPELGITDVNILHNLVVDLSNDTDWLNKKNK